MIVRVHQTGKDAAGLTRYLFGPGKVGEHQNQRMVGGSLDLAGEWAGSQLTMAQATHLGRVVEASWRRQYAPELAMAGVTTDGSIPERALHSGVDEVLSDAAASTSLVRQQDHVFHASLSLPADATPLTDEQWAKVAEEYVAGMEFTGVDGRPDCSWFAVNHGLSKTGNDHIHVVVCATRRDGSRASLHDTKRRSQEVRREALEKKLAFVAPLHESDRARNAPRLQNYSETEHNIATTRAKRGERDTATPDRALLQRIVRAAATQARTEAEFINNVLAASNRTEPGKDGELRRVGLEIEAARWEPGTNKQVVTGYKIRFQDMYAKDHQTGGHQKMWLSASSLSPDLTLGKLRKAWRTNETDDTTSYARALWADQASLMTPAAADADSELAEAAAHLNDVNTTLTTLDPTDTDAWNHAEAGAAGITAVIATGVQRDVDGHGNETGFSVEAGRASDVLTRQWLTDTHARHDKPASVPGGLSKMEIASRHVQLAVRSSGTDRHNGWLAVMQQLSRTIDAIAKAKAARNETVAAAVLQRDAVTAMHRLEEWLGTRVDGQPDAGPAGARPELSNAAQAALQASGHAQTGRPSARPTTTGPGQPARVDRNGPRPGPSRGPRR